MGTASDYILRDTGQIVWEHRITQESDGDTLLDNKITTNLRHRVYGVFRLATKEYFEKLGLLLDADAAFFSEEDINIKSMLEYNDTKYEIIEKIEINPYLDKKRVAYILKRTEA